MTTKEARLDFRLDPETKARIERAARLTRETISAFVVRSAATEADHVLARADVTIMPADQFDELFASLESAEIAPELARLARRERRYKRK